MMAFRNRAADKARRAASGGDGPPAGQDPQVPGEPATPAVADRKRLRETRRARDVLLHDLGALVMEMYRQGRHDPALVERKAREAIAVDSQLRGPPGVAAALAPPTGAPVLDGPPPAAGDRASGVPAPSDTPPASDAPPPAAADRVVEAPPPSPGDRVSSDAPPDTGDDGVPTYTVTTR